MYLDIINCEDDDGCHDNATCTDSNGSYTCACNDGFIGDGFNCSDHCENNTCGDDQICKTLPDTFQCACNNTDEFLVNGSCISSASIVQITGLTLNQVYLSDYADPSSMAYNALAAEIQTLILAFLQSSSETSNSGIFGVTVTSLTNGSVIANMTVASTSETISASSVENTINVGIANGTFSSLGATGTVQAQGTYHMYKYVF